MIGNQRVRTINTNDDEAIARAAKEIASYLSGRGQVAETIDGITHWWILRQRLYEERQCVERAVEYLCDEGLIEKRTLGDGSILYVATGNCSDENET